MEGKSQVSLHADELSGAKANAVVRLSDTSARSETAGWVWMWKIVGICLPYTFVLIWCRHIVLEWNFNSSPICCAVKRCQFLFILKIFFFPLLEIYFCVIIILIMHNSSVLITVNTAAKLWHESKIPEKINFVGHSHPSAVTLPSNIMVYGSKENISTPTWLLDIIL